MGPWPVSRRCPEPRWFIGDPTSLARDNIFGLLNRTLTIGEILLRSRLGGLVITFLCKSVRYNMFNSKVEKEPHTQSPSTCQCVTILLKAPHRWHTTIFYYFCMCYFTGVILYSQSFVPEQDIDKSGYAIGVNQKNPFQPIHSFQCKITCSI